MARKIEVIMGGSREPAVTGSTALRTQMPGYCITADAFGSLGNVKSLSQTAIDTDKSFK